MNARLKVAMMVVWALGTVSGFSQSQKLQDIPQFQLSFDNLAEEEKKTYFTSKAKADQYFRQKRIFESLEQIHDASQIFDEDPSLWNLKGSCYVEFRAFEKARTAFRKALSLQKENQGVKFNLAEIDFVTKNWKDSEEKFALFAASLEETPETLEQPNVSELHRLSQFKRLLCKIKLDDLAGAEELLEIHGDDLDDTPFTYFAKCALHYAKDEQGKANEWLGSAYRVFQDARKLANWQDTLIEFGYIKSFYGGDESQDEIDLDS